MKVSRIIVAPFLALTLLGASACGSQPADLRACTEYEDEVLDLDDEGECASEEDDEDGKKKKKKKSIGSTVKTGVDKVKSGSTKRSGSSSTRKK